MRLVINSLIGMMLVVVLGMVLVQVRSSYREHARVQGVQEALANLHAQAVYQQVMGEVDRSEAGYPMEVRLEWFGEQPPVNYVVNGSRPWIDVAPPDDLSDHPPDPIIVSDDQAAFWYNPNTGVFRARIEQQFTDGRSLGSYNTINDASLARLPFDPNPKRQPLAMRLVPTGSTQHASPEPVTIEQVLDHVDIDTDPGAEDAPQIEFIEPKPSDPAATARPGLDRPTLGATATP